MPDPLPLLASEKTFVDATLLYVSAGLLVALALALSFWGIRRHDDFPSSKAMKGLGALAGVLVVITAYGAVESARFEQAERRAENEEAAREANEATAEEEEAEAGQGAGEAAEPGAPEGEEGPGGGGSADLDAEGEQIFTSTGCGSCHTLAAAGSTGEIGPNLDEVLPGQSAQAIETSIIDPGDSVTEGFPEGTMPSDYSSVLDEGQLETLVRYLQANAGA